MPQISNSRAAYIIESRRAGRINAAQASDVEYKNLLRERSILVDKQLAATITRSEQIRLEYVRWSLDRIEDAQYGASLDILEAAVDRYETLSDEIRALQAQFNKLSQGRRNDKRR